MNAVVCQSVSKRYSLRMTSYRTMREFVGTKVVQLGRQKPPTSGDTEFWALRDASLEVSQGEALGIIGPNGSGKSTLLKIIAGITRPTRGRVEVLGRVGALIEVGTGLHHELTGRENIYLYGAILGLPRQEIRRKFEQIVEFSELGEFLDTPLKRYSSGMRVRLGFAIAAHLDPQILLVDEVLSVGDVGFQRKCVRYIRMLQEAGTTIILVSHELPTVERLCRRVVWIDGGRIREVGAGAGVVHHYLEGVERAFVTETRSARSASGTFTIEEVTLTDPRGVARFDFPPGEALTVVLRYRTNGDPIRTLVTLKVIDDQWSTVLVVHSPDLERGLELRGHGVLRCALPALPLAPKAYEVWAQVLRIPEYREEIPWQVVAAFSIASPGDAPEAQSFNANMEDSPVLQVPSTWSVTAHDRAGTPNA